MRKTVIGLFFLLLLCGKSAAEDITFVNWNILNYPGSTGAARNAHFRTVLTEVGPDLLVVQEMLSQTGVDSFLGSVLNTMEPGEWSAGVFSNGYDTDNAVFYRTSVFDIVDSGIISTALRDINWWQMQFLSTGDEFRLYTAHLKASSGSSNEAKRLAECQELRNDLDSLAAGTHYIFAADLNVYKGTESAYQLLLSAGDGQLIDPISQNGNWHNNAGYASIHTQSPRVTSFGGGATGGMDDRFDQILVSNEFLDATGLELLPATYNAFGNDGAHFNQAINAGGNGVVSQAVADAIHAAADHLPVVVTLSSPANTSVATAAPALQYRLVATPNPFNPTTMIRFHAERSGHLSLAIYDPAGRLIATLANEVRNAGEVTALWNGTNNSGRPVAGGVYFAHLTMGGVSAASRIVLIR